MSNVPSQQAGGRARRGTKKTPKREGKRNKAWCELVIYYHAISVMKFSNNFSVQQQRKQQHGSRSFAYARVGEGIKWREKNYYQEGVCRVAQAGVHA